MRKHPQRSVGLLGGDTNQPSSERRTAKNVAAAKIKTPGSRASSVSSSIVAKRKVEELFRRLQPHSLVQSTDKLLATLKIAPKLYVNGKELLPKAPPAATVAVAASTAGTGSRRPTSTTAAWRFKPEAGRFRYGLSLQYPPSDAELTLSSLKDARIMLASTAMQTTRSIPVAKGGELNRKTWRLVAETDRRVGLALYEIPVGDWGASSLVALVWNQKCEIARLFLQLHTTELLYSTPQRPLQFRCDDDLDQTHGLHSYTAAISLRSLDELFWEHEVYQIEFPTPKYAARTVTVQLLDNVHGGTVSARDRVLSSETEAALRVETEAVKCVLDNCLVVDFTVWDAECVPVWGFSRVLELATASEGQRQDDGNGIDFSVSSLGGTTKRIQLKFLDERQGNELTISLTKLSPLSLQQSTKKTKVWVSQVDLTLSLQFINATFGTKYSH